MNNFNDKYNIRDFIDKNKWSNVYVGQNNETGEEVILNRLINASQNESKLEKLKEEVSLLKEINSPNLTRINGMSTYSNQEIIYHYIESEYFEGVTLKELRNNEDIDEKECLAIIGEVIKGIKDLNNHNFKYDNLKQEDIIISNEGIVKVNLLSYINNHEGHISLEETHLKKKNNDVYMIGSILCKILTNKNQYTSELEDIELNEAIIEIIKKSTCKKPISKNKYKNLDEFLMDISNYLQYDQLTNEILDDEIEEDDDKSSKTAKRCIAITCYLVILMGGIGMGSKYVLGNMNNEEGSQISQYIPMKRPVQTEEPKEEEVEEEEDTVDDNYTYKNNDTNDTYVEETPNNDEPEYIYEEVPVEDNPSNDYWQEPEVSIPEVEYPIEPPSNPEPEYPVEPPSNPEPEYPNPEQEYPIEEQIQEQGVEDEEPVIEETQEQGE